MSAPVPAPLASTIAASLPIELPPELLAALESGFRSKAPGAFPKPGPTPNETDPAASQPEFPDSEHGTPFAAGPGRPSNSKAARDQITPPLVGSGSVRRYRIRWNTFNRYWARPAVMEDDLIDDLYNLIERFGVSDARAALLHKLDPSALARWKAEHPALEHYLEIARGEFELNQIHKIEGFKRRDSDQPDPQGAKWLLERSNPESWGRPSARRQNSAPRSEVSRGPATAGGTPSPQQPKPPAPNTPEYWDYVEEEPFSRDLSTCIITPGRQKFYATVHLTESKYLPDPDPNDPPTADLTPAQRAADNEDFLRLQDHYFSLPEDERLPFLHRVFEQQYGKVLPENQRPAEAATPPPAPGSAPVPSVTPAPVPPKPAVSPENSNGTQTTVTPEKQPSEYSREENLAHFHELARREQERRKREAHAVFENSVAWSSTDPYAPCTNDPGGY